MDLLLKTRRVLEPLLQAPIHPARSSLRQATSRTREGHRPQLRAAVTSQEAAPPRKGGGGDTRHGFPKTLLMDCLGAPNTHSLEEQRDEEETWQWQAMAWQTLATLETLVASSTPGRDACGPPLHCMRNSFFSSRGRRIRGCPWPGASASGPSVWPSFPSTSSTKQRPFPSAPQEETLPARPERSWVPAPSGGSRHQPTR